MSRVRSNGNLATEIALARFFRRNNISGWRRRAPIFGKPDFVFPPQRLAVFVDGCFWHGCPKHGSQPSRNSSFWKSKLARNKARDRLVARKLRVQGWRVLRVWQHELRRRNEHRLALRIRSALNSRPRRVEHPFN
jgi:DNA mismatch endonuclease, patch repair protein